MSVIHWFRKGLRLHDNPALLAAVEKINDENYELRPIFILDPWIVQKLRVGPNRWRFLQQSLNDLDTSLRGQGTRLYVIRGKPEEVFVRLFKNWKVKRLTFEEDIEPYAKERDNRVEALARQAQVEVIKCVSHTLYNPDSLIALNFGKAPLTYQKFLSLVDKAGIPLHPSVSLFNLPLGCLPATLDSSQMYDVPTLSELGVVESDLGPCLFPGGETTALKRLTESVADKKYVCHFEKPNTSPTSLQPSTTALSPYLKFGCLSARTFYFKLKEVLAGCKNASKPPVSLLGQLLWREFYYTVGADTNNFDKMIDNKICIQVPWDTNIELLEAWRLGKTGYPWIDAVMTQLRQEGWIHHLARHSVACFLTRGDLWLSWEEGQKVFEEYLLDADWALNAGNWMWLSASAFFHQFFRVYSPVAFPKKTDKTGEYICKYVPVLRKLPSNYIYEPWLAPKDVLTKAECFLGENYPHRIVIHEEVYKVNIARMRQAYKANKANKEPEDKSKQKRGHGDDETEKRGSVSSSSKLKTSKSTSKKNPTQPSITRFLRKK